MAHCRLRGDCDLYVIESDDGFECIWCAFPPHDKVVVATADEMVDHVREHIAAGHKVPDYVIPGLLSGDGYDRPDS